MRSSRRPKIWWPRLKNCWLTNQWRRGAFALAFTILLTGCAANSPKLAAVPAPPAPKPDPPALIFPQTVLELPDPQPVPPEAILKREQPAQPAVAETQPARTPPHRAPTAVKREAEPSEPNPGPEPAKASSRTPLVPVDPNLPKSDMIQKRIDALKAMEPKLASRKGKDADVTRGRLHYFIDQAAQALARNDVRQADALASRAQVLAEDLLNVR